MRVIARRSEIKGMVEAPKSKSFTHRALIAAALAHGKSTIMHPLASEDTEVTTDLLKALGIEIEDRGRLWVVNGGELMEPKRDLFCKESGTSLRLATALCTLVKGKCKITGAPGLLKRPIGELVNALRQLGADCTANGDFPPVITNNSFIGGSAFLRGDVSSQFVSALLFVSPLGGKTTTIRLSTPLESAPYVRMTLSTMKSFGVDVVASEGLARFDIEQQRYKTQTYEVEGDWSSASFLLAGGAMAGSAAVSGLDTKSTQADVAMLDILYRMGADISIRGDTIITSRSTLHAINYDVSNCPDVFPILAAMCSVAEGKSTISGIRRLAMKESDRVAEMGRGLANMGIGFKKNSDSIEITGGKPKGSVIYANDHRIAMAFGVLGLVADKATVIENAECVGKSFPDFWERLRQLNCDIGVE
jgi:3-phosphoshikimate 1-carboxyvinyltransferase